jgi:hypothetical protein
MEKKKKENGKEVGRREFVKKMAYLAPAVAVLVVPKYTAAQGGVHGGLFWAVFSAVSPPM